MSAQPNLTRPAAACETSVDVRYVLTPKGKRALADAELDAQAMTCRHSYEFEAGFATCTSCGHISKLTRAWQGVRS